MADQPYDERWPRRLDPVNQDTLPDHPVVVQPGDISRGARILAARARSG